MEFFKRAAKDRDRENRWRPLRPTSFLLAVVVFSVLTVAFCLRNPFGVFFFIAFFSIVLAPFRCRECWHSEEVSTLSTRRLITALHA
ncbi:hypothetical protein K1719_022305 [Acacia pycnantha]|nr:hypothetical protein K1719_022305 [Acacia pycnantha]